MLVNDKDRILFFCPETGFPLIRGGFPFTRVQMHLTATGSYRPECLVVWWGIATGGSVPKGPKPLRYGPEVVGESFAPKD